MQKIFQIARIVNIVAAIILFPLMVIGSLYAIDGYLKNGVTDPFFIAFIGYVTAALFALLSLWKKEFFYISLFGWALFAIGNHFDEKRALAENDRAQKQSIVNQ